EPEPRLPITRVTPSRNLEESHGTRETAAAEFILLVRRNPISSGSLICSVTRGNGVPIDMRKNTILNLHQLTPMDHGEFCCLFCVGVPLLMKSPIAGSRGEEAMIGKVLQAFESLCRSKNSFRRSCPASLAVVDSGWSLILERSLFEFKQTRLG